MARAPELDELLPCLPHAVARLDPALRFNWLSAGFEDRLGFPVRLGEPAADLFGPGPARSELEQAASERRSHSFSALTRELLQTRVRLQPLEGGDWLLVLEAGGDGEDAVAFAQALQEISRAVGETLDVDAACAAAVVSMVRSEQLERADVFLSREGGGLRRIATSGLGVMPQSDDGLAAHDSVQLAMSTGHPQVGLSLRAGQPPVMFAAIPVVAQRRALGVLVLFKGRSAGFSRRELDLWSSAAGQLAVAVENGRLYREVEAALRVREDFMSIASHELKTPLTALRLGLHSIEKRILQGSPVELGQVLKCNRQVDRLTALVSDLLDASRLERGRLTVDRTPFDLARLALDVVSTCRAEQGREIALQLPPEKLHVLGDRSRMEQVLLNLLENAIKYSPQGSPIRVIAGKSGGRARILVEDEGIGIPACEHERVFDKFYRAQNSSARNYGGLGLGLFISRSVLQLHGGSLTVASEVGKGATFTAALPLLSEEEVAHLRRRVLVVDEDAQLRAEAGEALGAAGFDVLEARDPADALARLSQIDVDVVLASATLHGKAAAVLSEAIGRSFASHPISLVVSGPALPAWAGPGARLCARPLDRDQLLDAIRSAVEPAERTAAAR